MERSVRILGIVVHVCVGGAADRKLCTAASGAVIFLITGI
jgi:hypothetical protein